MKLSTKTIIISGFLVALNIILSRLLIIPGIINFGGFPIIFGGIVFGPLVGGIVGAVGDVVSYIIRPMGVFMPHFTLTSTLTGVIPGILVRTLKLNWDKPSLWKIFIAILVGQVTTSVLMVPYFRYILFGHPLFLTMTRAAARQTMNIPVYSIIIKLMIPILYKSGSLKEYM